MIEYKEMTPEHIEEMADLFVEAFNAEPWREEWTKDTASKRLQQMINVEDFYGLCAYAEEEMCGMILGCMEQYYDGIVFQIREFCVKNTQRGQGTGGRIYQEFEKRLKTMGITEINLVTTRGQYTEHFYHKQGIEGYAEMLVMRKKLK